MTQASALITNLPYAAIKNILEQDALSFRDVVNFASTCTLFRPFSKDNNLWRNKSLQRWPTLRSTFEAYRNLDVRVNWLQEIQQNYELRKELFESLSKMSEKYFLKLYLSMEQLFDRKHIDIFNDSNHQVLMTFEELLHFINTNESENLTQKYYAKQMVVHLRKIHGAMMWQALQSLPQEEQLMEKIAILFEEWLHPENRMINSSVMAVLDELALKVESSLQADNPAHPLFRIPDEESRWQWCARNIEDDQFNSEEAIQVLHCLCKMMIQEFSCCQNQIPIFYLSKVLMKKAGSHLILSIICISIARRLGVKCELGLHSNAVTIHWKERHSSKSWNKKGCYTINLCPDECTILKNDKTCFFKKCEKTCTFEKSEFSQIGEELFRLMSDTLHYYESLFNNHLQLFRDSKFDFTPLKLCYEFSYMISPNYEFQKDDLNQWFLDNEDRIQLTRARKLKELKDAKLVEKKNIDLKEFGQDTLYKIERFEWESSMQQIEPFVKYPIGTILSHKLDPLRPLCNRTQYDSDSESEYSTDEVTLQNCVVIGWKAFYGSPHIGMSYSPSTVQYKVLYNKHQALVMQDELVPVAPEFIRPIKNKLIGKYFKSFNQVSYLPNKELQALFSEDESDISPYLEISVESDGQSYIVRSGSLLDH